MSARVLKKLPDYENLRKSFDFYKRIKNVDVIQTEQEGEIALCHIVEMNRYSMLVEGERIPFPTELPREALAAITLALEHLNTGNGEVIKEIEGINKRCNVRFTAEFIDTSGQENQAVDSLVDILQREQEKPKEQSPCSFIGAFRSQVSIPTALLTGLKGYIQFSAMSTTTQLNNKDTYPLFGRLLPTNDQYAFPLLDYLYNELGVRHFAILHTDNTFGLDYVRGIRKAIIEVYPDMHIETVSISSNAQLNDISIAVDAIKQTKLRYIFAIFDSGKLDNIMLEAYRQGIAGTREYIWISSNLGASRNLLLGKKFEKNDPLRLACDGLITFSTVGSLPGIGRYDAFVNAWKHLANPQDILYLQSKLPLVTNNSELSSKFNADLFEESSLFTPLYYDTAIAIGLAACSASKNTTYFDGKDHYKAILETSFEGASGFISLDPETGSRNTSSSLFTLNKFSSIELEGSTSKIFTEIQAAHYSAGKWISTKPVVGNGTEIPSDLPAVTFNYHYIGVGLRTGGLVMSSVVLLLSIFLSYWAWHNRKSRVVRASQGIFLQIICLGTFLMGLSIIPLSLDDEITDAEELDTACMSFVWLLSFGWCCSFAALFTKVMRVNKIFRNPKFQKFRVTISDVIKPMVILLSVNTIILAMWTSFDPLKWKRTVVVTDEFGRGIESEGHCTSQNGLHLFFLIPLLILDIGALIFASWQAYAARKISIEFAESEYITRSMGLIMVVFFVGIPVVYIAENNPQASFFVLAAIVFVICLSLLCLIFIPKIAFHHKKVKEKFGNSIKVSLGLQNIPSEQESSNNSTETNLEEGMRVIEHPKLREDLKYKIQLLENEKVKMASRIKELESIIKNDVGFSVEMRCRVHEK